MKNVDFKDGKATVTFDTFGSSLRAFDVQEVRGFALCGEDKVWHWAKGTIKGKDTVEVTSAEVKQPVALRYAWANNPVCNLYSEEGLPATPFRTDDFPMITAPKPTTTSTAPAAPAKTPATTPATNPATPASK